MTEPIKYDDRPGHRPTFQPQFVGRTILSAWIGRDELGYDLLSLVLDDGTTLQAHETSSPSMVLVVSKTRQWP